MRPGRRIALAALPLLAAVAASAGAPAILREPLGFLLVGVLPGVLAARALLADAPPEELAMAGLALAIPVGAAARAAAFLAGGSATAFLWALAALCAAAALALPAPRERIRPDPVAWLSAAALALFVAVPQALNPVTRVFGDSMFHAQIVLEILRRGIPPQDPSYFGMPLTYMWGFHVWGAAVCEAMGITPYDIFPWVGGSMMAVVALGAYRLARELWPERAIARLAPAIVALGMNALGWLWLVPRLALWPILQGHAAAETARRLAHALFVAPYPNSVSSQLLRSGYMVLGSLLYKFMCANTLGAAMALVVATAALAFAALRGAGAGRLAALAIAAMGMGAVHPLLGLPAGAALLVGLAASAWGASARAPALRAAAAVGAGLAAAAGLDWLMLHGGITGGEQTRIHFMTVNLPALLQDLLVVAVPAVLGWLEARRASPALARLGLGFAASFLVLALFLDLPYIGEVYLVYGVYLGVAIFAAAGLRRLWQLASRRRAGSLAAVGLALILLPNALLLFNAFARQATGRGFAGYPETGDERAAFDYLRDRVPNDAVVVDTQFFSGSAAAAYSGRRGFYGGMRQADLVGYPHDVMAARERCVLRLLLLPGLDDSVFAALDAVRAPLFVVGRRTPARVPLVFPPPRPMDSVAKLDSVPQRFRPRLRTPTVAIYEYVPRPGSAGR